jgi:hypothetical protein
MPGQYDDWELEVRSPWDGGNPEILINLPHNEPKYIEIATNTDDVKTLANILDAGLCALNGVDPDKREKLERRDDGSNPTGLTG